MATNPELQDALQELDHELEEGDITRKGYEKRRTILLSQYFPPEETQPTHRGGLRIHSPDDSDHPAAKNTTGGVSKPLSVVKGEGAYGQGSIRSRNSSLDYPQGHVQRLQERETGTLRPPQRQSSYGSYESLFLPKHNQLAVEPSPDASRSQTLVSQNYAFNPDQHVQQGVGVGADTRNSTMLDSQQQYFSDFTGQQLDDRQEVYGGAHRYSQTEPFSPTAQMAPPLLSAGDLPSEDSTIYQQPLEPRDIPFNVCDPHDHNIEMSKFDNIAMVLRHRAKTNGKQPAYWVLDPKGKELVSITWEKLASRAEKVAQVIRDKSSLYRGDRVALIYRDTEVVEFAVALMGCFIAGVVAVPINDLKDYRRLNIILTSAQAHLALTTEANLKNFQRDITAAKLNWPRGVEWWKTNEFGSYNPKKKGEEPPLVVPDLAYIEFSTAPTGDLRGVVMSHRTIMHQMACLSAIVSTAPLGNGDTFSPALRDKQGKSMSSGNRSETILSYLDPREGIGMILGILLDVYGGHTTIWFEAPAAETPGLYASLITKYRATLLVADYPRLKHAVYNYQSDPMATRNFKKGIEPNFSSVRLCLIDTLTVDSDFHELLADRWLRPLRNTRAREVVAPMLCLPEHGGMVISVKDCLGGEERMGCSLSQKLGKEDSPIAKDHEDTSKAKSGFGSSLIGGTTAQPSKRETRTNIDEVLLDKEALKSNEVHIRGTGAEAREKQSSLPNTLRCGAFGYPLPDATLAVVDPETCMLCRPDTIGEIWVDSPSLSGGFWALPKHTEAIFHARPWHFKQGNPTPILTEPEFLRTGLLGTVIQGKIFVLGLYEDRLRQKVEWVEHGMEDEEHRYFFVQHLISSIMKKVPKIHDCSAFDVFVNNEHLPIVLIESFAASTAPLTSGGPPRQLDIALLDSLSERCMEVLLEEHHLRVYCVMITAPNTLPRVSKNGRDEIGNMRCRKEFDNGSLPCVHVKFGVERAVLNLPIGEDPIGGIWAPVSTAARQEILMMQEKQYSGVDPREVVIDDRTSTPLNNFSSIVDLMQWRVARQADELAYCTVDGRGREGKGLTWKKFDQRVASVAMYLKNKVKIRAGDHIILMYTHSEEFVFAVHACLCLGAVAIPVAPLDQNRLAEDAPAFLHVVADMIVRCVIVNADVDSLLKQKIVSQHLKQSANFLKINVPSVYSTAKPPKQSHGCRDLGLKMTPSWVAPNRPAIIWTYWSPDQRRVSIQLGHDTIMGMCKVQKETCQMSSSRPVLGCVRSTMGLGFIHTCLMGVYIGAPTYLISPVDFAQNPQCLFMTLARYKVKDTYATSQMLEFAMNSMPGKGFSLHELRNMMISTESRPQADVCKCIRQTFSPLTNADI
jgi:acyl-CoA synthetase (AMP-forming)/AMP-acid ligase II